MQHCQQRTAGEWADCQWRLGFGGELVQGSFPEPSFHFLLGKMETVQTVRQSASLQASKASKV